MVQGKCNAQIKEKVDAGSRRNGAEVEVQSLNKYVDQQADMLLRLGFQT